LCGDLGRLEEALKAASRAVEIYQQLAKQKPDAFEADLAVSLNNLSLLHIGLGTRDEALESAERASEI
jgi:tetratricopeptide (TPR) repeat protein